MVAKKATCPRLLVGARTGSDSTVNPPKRPPPGADSPIAATARTVVEGAGAAGSVTSRMPAIEVLNTRPRAIARSIGRCWNGVNAHPAPRRPRFPACPRRAAGGGSAGHRVTRGRARPSGISRLVLLPRGGQALLHPEPHRG